MLTDHQLIIRRGKHHMSPTLRFGRDVKAIFEMTVSSFRNLYMFGHEISSVFIHNNVLLLSFLVLLAVSTELDRL
jgi:hypothetical protein